MLFCVSLTCSQLKEWIKESPIKIEREREREREREHFFLGKKDVHNFEYLCTSFQGVAN